MQYEILKVWSDSNSSGWNRKIICSSWLTVFWAEVSKERQGWVWVGHKTVKSLGWNLKFLQRDEVFLMEMLEDWIFTSLFIGNSLVSICILYLVANKFLLVWSTLNKIEGNCKFAFNLLFELEKKTDFELPSVNV